MLRKKIAVITARADDRIQKDILLGIAEAAFSENVDVVVFSNIHNHWIKDNVLNFENIIYDFFDPSDFGGVIITAEAFMDLSMFSDVFEKIREAKKPAAVIGGEIEGFHSLFFDDDDDMEKLCEHLITIHNITDIHILTGPKENIFSHRRVRGCKRAFEKHGIPFDENKVFFGDFWYDSGESLANRYISGELSLPQAVMCANDCMAYQLCDALSVAGIRIPEDVTVTGYDYTGGRIYHYPVLTTFRGGRRTIGIKAVNYLLSSNYTIDDSNRFVSGSTCSCGTNPSELYDEIYLERIDHPNMFLSSVAQFCVAQFSVDLTLCRTLREYIEALNNYFYLLHGASSLYLCLDKDWNSSEYAGDAYLCCEINGMKTPGEPIMVSKGTLLSAITQSRQKPAVYYFSPVYFQTRFYGCAVSAYETPDGYDFSFRNWNQTISNALEFLRLKNDNHYLSLCQRTSSLYDALTGFCKITEFRRSAEESDSKKTGIIAIKVSFCSDKEYSFERNYQSDIISSFAQTIKQICTDKEICCRADNNLFLILCHEKREILSERINVILHRNIYAKYYENPSLIISVEDCEGYSSKDIDNIISKTESSSGQTAFLLKNREPVTQFNNLLELRKEVITNPQASPDTDSASRKLCISIGYFRSVYKKCFGVSYVQDCINEKIMLARYLLCTTVMSIYTIAVQCGYTSEKYFARQFKQTVGMSPIQYRKRYCAPFNHV